MEIENSFDVPVPPAQAWSLLTDVPTVATCLPGATVSGRDEDGGYTGEFAVRLGPVSMTFGGRLRFEQLDEGDGVAVAVASARELRNRGSADAHIRFTLTPQARGTRVHVLTDLTLAGQAAQYGRAAGVLKSVSSLLLGRFAACLARRIEEGSAA